ncbi:MAG: SDR family oxidoreductase [Candidatus Omnitrophica bacterium]|nr:SDR family oxidoreductase [Candidatus Omnitrophota bacterium]
MSSAVREKLEKKVAIVTGGGKGYGRGIAAALKKKRAEVWITGRNEENLQKAAEQMGVYYFKADVTSAKDWEALFKKVNEKHKRVDVLINNAGAGIRVAPANKQSEKEIRRSIEVNLIGAILGCRQAAEIMKKQNSGIIVNISSVCAVEAWPEWSVYSAAKAGLLQFSRCLYTELRPFGVRVSCLLPSWGATDFVTAAGLKDFSPATKLRCIHPEQLGEMVASLCELPHHLCVESLILWPMVQEVVPL